MPQETYTFKRSGDIGLDFKNIFKGDSFEDSDLQKKFRRDLGSFLEKNINAFKSIDKENLNKVYSRSSTYQLGPAPRFPIWMARASQAKLLSIDHYWVLSLNNDIIGDTLYYIVPDPIMNSYMKRFASLMGYGEKSNVGIDTSVYESKITETKLKQIIKEELNLLKKEKEIERNKDQFAHKFSSVFVEALELDPDTETGKNTLNEVYFFLKQYSPLNEVLDNWVTYPVSADGSIMYSNPINALPGATPEGVGAGGLIKLFKAGPNDKNVTYAVTVNTGKLNTLGADKVKVEIARLLKNAADKSIDQAQDNTNEIGDPFADDSLANNAGPLKELGEAIEYPKDVKTTPVSLLIKMVVDAHNSLPGVSNNDLIDMETFARGMQGVAVDLISVNKEGYKALKKVSDELRAAVKERSLAIRSPTKSLVHKGFRDVTEGMENDVGNILENIEDPPSTEKRSAIAAEAAKKYYEAYSNYIAACRREGNGKGTLEDTRAAYKLMNVAEGEVARALGVTRVDIVRAVHAQERAQKQREDEEAARRKAERIAAKKAKKDIVV